MFTPWFYFRPASATSGVSSVLLRDDYLFYTRLGTRRTVPLCRCGLAWELKRSDRCRSKYSVSPCAYRRPAPWYQTLPGWRRTLVRFVIMSRVFRLPPETLFSSDGSFFSTPASIRSEWGFDTRLHSFHTNTKVRAWSVFIQSQNICSGLFSSVTASDPVHPFLFPPDINPGCRIWCPFRIRSPLAIVLLLINDSSRASNTSCSLKC